MVGVFGDIVFTVSSFRVLTFRDLKQDVSARYASHEVIGTKPKKEYLGPGLKGMSLTIELHSYLGTDPEGTAKYLETISENGMVCRFILGGVNKGKYTVNSVSQSYNLIKNDGDVISLSIDLTLEEYH